MPSIPEHGQALSPRESDVLSTIAGGCYSAKLAARQLGISHRTVEIHMRNAIEKLGAHNQLHAVLMWDRNHRAATPLPTHPQQEKPNA